MNKTNIKTEFYNLLKPLKDEGIEIVGLGNENFNKTPLIAYKIMDKYPIIIQNKVERFTEWYFFIQAYGDSSVECTGLSDRIDNILKPIGFIEMDFQDGFDKESGKFVITSVYRIRLDDNGYSYNLI